VPSVRRDPPRLDDAHPDQGLGLSGTTGQPARAVGLVIRAVLGFVLAAAVYLLLGPLLENTSARDLQGMLWNIVPLLTVVGAAVGWSVVRH
jgi:hypothetical protein